MKAKNNFLFIGLIFLAFLAVFIYYVNSNTDNSLNANKQTNILNKNNDKIEDDIKENLIEYSGTLYYTKIFDNSWYLYNKKANQEEKLLFTDKDELEKIKFPPTIIYDGSIFAVFENKNNPYNGILYQIQADGSGNKTIINNNLITNTTPSISPDGKLLAYTLFSNAEFSYGFTLYISSVDGNNIVKIDTDATNITNLAISTDSKQIAYIKANKQLYIADIDGKKQTKIFEITDSNNISGLSWSKNNLIVCEENSKIISIDSEKSNSEIIYQNDNLSISNAFVNNDSYMYLNKKDNAIYYNQNQKITSDDINNIIQWLN